MCKNSLACIISLINVYNHLHSEVSQICFEGGVAKTLYIPYKLILIGGVANQNNFATPPKYLRHLLTMQLKSRVKTNLRHFPTIIQLYLHSKISKWRLSSRTWCQFVKIAEYLRLRAQIGITERPYHINLFAEYLSIEFGSQGKTSKAISRMLNLQFLQLISNHKNKSKL